MAPGQSQVISVPGPAGSEQQELHIQRLGDRIEVAQARRQDTNARVATN